MLDFLKAVFLGVLQGLTEFLPISSSAHLRIFPEFLGWQDRGHVDARMGWYVIIGSVPIVLLGVALKNVIEQDFRNLWVIGTTLIVLGVVLGFADKMSAGDRAIKQMNLKHAGLLGLAQACALIPGVSATVVSFIVGYSAIAWLLRYVTTKSYLPFVIYRIGLGALVLALLAGGVIAA